MKTLTLAAFLAGLSFAGLHAQTVIVDDGSTFSPGALDIYNLPGYSSSYNGGADFTDNQPVPGQTFTTTTSAPAFALNSVTLQEQGAGNGYELATTTYALGIFSINGSALTYIGGGSYTFGGTAAAVGDYVTLNLTAPVLLLAGTQYAFTLNIATGGGYFGLDGGYPSNDTYAGGQAITATFDTSRVPSTDGTITTPSETPYDRNFDIGIVEAPEPATWALVAVGAGLMLGAARLRRRSA
jgi:hypothetical protein